MSTVLNEHRITMNDVQNLLAGEAGLDLAPVIEGGRQTCMRIGGVREGTTASRLGAQNGDTIETINDMPLLSIPDAYRVGEAVRGQQRIVIKGKRAGTPYVTTLTVES